MSLPILRISQNTQGKKHGLDSLSRMILVRHSLVEGLVSGFAQAAPSESRRVNEIWIARVVRLTRRCSA